MVIDLFDLEEHRYMRRFPEVYQHLLAKVKPERDRNSRPSYRSRWWIFGEPDVSSGRHWQVSLGLLLQSIRLRIGYSSFCQLGRFGQ